jgi:SAM-dependent methyltransferase
MLDDVARYNRERWEDLARAGVQFSRPWLDLDPALARARVDEQGMAGDVAGKDVLCLAGGGGQQSVAFALLGARVTVLDLSPTQLARDRETAARYGVTVRTVEGDMRDLESLPDAAFDLVWHAHALSFVPDAAPVFDEVARVLRAGGQYRLHWANPFVHGVWDEVWKDGGYPLRHPYVDGAEVPLADPEWNVRRADGTVVRVRGPREWRHGLGAVVNGLIARGFVIRGLWETTSAQERPEPGTWEHLKSIAPPWLTLWARRENMVPRARRPIISEDRDSGKRREGVSALAKGKSMQKEKKKPKQKKK